MANDIFLIDSGNPISNGGAVIKTQGAGNYQAVSGSGDSLPVIADIQAKYDARLDSPRYYTGDAAT